MANTIEIIIKATDQASKTIDQIEAKATGSTEKTGKSFSALGLAAKAAALGGVALLAEGLKASVEAAMEGELALAKTNAVIKSTGGIAGYTADQIVKMSEAWAQQTGVGHDVIQSAENVMLTFTSIGKEAFPQAMEAALNLSTALGTDLQGAVIQVGKALQDPITGMTALRRVGVNFNDAAKTTIENFIKIGDLAGAQRFILKELATEFGGVAAAAGDTLTGKIGKLRDALDKLEEKVGEKVIPTLSAIAQSLLDSSIIYDDTAAAVDRLAAAQRELNDAQRTSRDTTTDRTIIENLQKRVEELQKVVALEKLVGQTTEEQASRSGMAHVRAIQMTVGAGQDLIDYLNAEQSGMKKAADAAQTLANRQAALLTVGIASALKNEAKSFGTSQEELRKRLKETEDELTQLEIKQGAVAKTTVKNAMSTNELAAANARLADMQRQLSKETDPIKQAELAAQIGVQRDKINEANTAVSSYVDNSKRISELKGQYDDINKEIEANAKTHEEATRRILYGYAEQAIARANALAGITVMTDTEVKALDALAVQFGIKSQDDVNAMNAILGAAEKLPTGGAKAFDDFLNVVTGRLTMAEQNAQAYADKGFAPIEYSFIKVKDTIKKYGAEPVIVPVKVDPKKAKEDAAALVNSKEMAKVKDIVTTPIKADTSAAISSLNWLSKYGVDPLIAEYDALIARALRFNQIAASTPSTLGTTGGTCFAADTSILMIDGSTKPIQDIISDDVIQSFDDSGSLVAGRVLTIQQHEVEEYYALAFEHDRVIVTGEHPFYAPKIKRNVKRAYSDFVAARDLRIGDVVEAVINGRRAQTWLLDMMREEGHIAVYNFTVDAHTYIANGLLVHNAKAPGAQHGADFIVPPGYSGDRFPLRVSSGEHVVVTPANQSSGGNLPAINISQTFNGAQSSPEQYKAIMYEVITDVINSATRQ